MQLLIEKTDVMKSYITLLLLASTLQGYAQQKPQATFTSPLNFPLMLSGNFGELRANHFHNGLDFKTSGASGKAVFALGNGYISRIRVTHGSGYVLDVVYDNGYSTINRHLSALVAPIAQRVEALQYEQESWEVEIIPEPEEYRVKSFQQIAWSGNMGYSFGPHLHLEMYETGSGDYVDPILFFANQLKDTTAPKATNIILCPQVGVGVVAGSDEPQTFSIYSAKPIEAWGVIGAGIKAYDYMDGVNNHYGVHTVVLSVDGTEMFRSTLDRYSPSESRMINSWTYGQYMKSFIDPGNTLRMLHAAYPNRGLITIDQPRNYLFVYQLTDAFGNTSRYSFTVRGTPQPIEQPLPVKAKYLLAWDKINFLQEPGLTLVLPKGVLYQDVSLRYSMRADSNCVAFTYQLHNQPISLHGSCELSIGLRRKPIADMSKYYVARVTDKGGKYSAGGVYQDGFMKTRIRELGTYTVAIDTVPPQVIAISKHTWARKGRVVYKLRERETGIRSYYGTIDDKYALFGMQNAVDKQIICEIDPKRITKGKSHTVVITVIDDCGNQIVVRDTFVW